MAFDTITPFRVAIDLMPASISNETFTPPVLSRTSGEAEDVVPYPRTHNTSDSDDSPDTSFSSTSTAVATPPNTDEDIENIAPFRFTVVVPHLKADKHEDARTLDSRERDYAANSSVLNIVVPEPKERELRVPLGVLYEKPTPKGALYKFSQNGSLSPLSSLSGSIFSSPRRRAIFSAEEKSLVHSLICC